MKIRHIAQLGVVACLAFAGVTLGTTTASAEVWGGGCRAYVMEPGDVEMDSCAYAADTSNSWNSTRIYPAVSTIEHQWNPGDPDQVDPCAQLMRVNPDGSLTQIHDFVCGGWVGPGQGGPSQNEWSGTDRAWSAPAGGTYVVQSGYWATVNGHYGYYGNVQSPRIYT
nr:hypothetical protein StreXyl84_00910 [Streptomyces sp. Xyl84]